MLLATHSLSRLRSLRSWRGTLTLRSFYSSKLQQLDIFIPLFPNNLTVDTFRQVKHRTAKKGHSLPYCHLCNWDYHKPDPVGIPLNGSDPVGIPVNGPMRWYYH